MPVFYILCDVCYITLDIIRTLIKPQSSVFRRPFENSWLALSGSRSPRASRAIISPPLHQSRRSRSGASSERWASVHYTKTEWLNGYTRASPRCRASLGVGVVKRFTQRTLTVSIGITGLRNVHPKAGCRPLHGAE